MSKFSIIYAWFVRTVFFFFPDIPFIMRIRGKFYSVFMRKCGVNFQVAHNVIINTLNGLECGDNVYVAPNSILLCGGGLKIGDNVLIAPNCLISTNNHTFSVNSYRFGERKFEEVSVGSGSWVCSNAVVVAGSNVPERSIVCPNSTFNLKSGDSDSMYSGVPAKFIKRNR